MANKFFSYSFQVRRSKTGGIIFILFIIIITLGGFMFYRSRNNYTNFSNLEYKTSFGMNEFEDPNCDKAYRLNYDKKTCGTYCIKKVDNDKDYIKDLTKKIKENGFTVSKVYTKKINGNTWKYVNTTNDGLKLRYYVLSDNKDMYILEHIDQTTYLSKNIKNKCIEIDDNFINSLTIK